MDTQRFGPDYNLDFEPHSTIYADQLMVDPDNNQVIGIQRTSSRVKGPVDSAIVSPNTSRSISEIGKVIEGGILSERKIHVDDENFNVKFNFAGPKRTSDERHHFENIAKHYAGLSSKKGSLSELASNSNP